MEEVYDRLQRGEYQLASRRLPIFSRLTAPSAAGVAPLCRAAMNSLSYLCNV